MLSGFPWISLFERRNALSPVLLLLFSFWRLDAEEFPIDRIHFDKIHSTQTFAKEHAQKFLNTPDAWIVITADHQTNGVAHQGRKWESSSSGNLYATFVTLYPKNREEELLHVIQISAFAVVKTLQDFHFEPRIKWINDIFLNGKKISGCLCEIVPSHLEDYYYLLIGIGVNVNMNQAELALIPTSATSMYAETLTVVDSEQVLRSLSGHLRCSVNTLLQVSFSQFQEEINRLLLFKGQMVEIDLGANRIVQGTILGIDDEGALLLELPHEKIQKVYVGRIVRVIDEKIAS